MTYLEPFSADGTALWDSTGNAGCLILLLDTMTFYEQFTQADGRFNGAVLYERVRPEKPSHPPAHCRMDDQVRDILRVTAATTRLDEGFSHDLLTQRHLVL